MNILRVFILLTGFFQYFHQPAIYPEDINETDLKTYILKLDFSDIDTTFIDQNAMISMVHFGKGILEEEYLKKISVNSEINPVLYQYYLKGSWGVY